MSLNHSQAAKWLHAQDEELACWTNIADKLRSEIYCQKKKEYWLRILKKTGLAEEHLASSILEVGCGPSGLFMVMPDQAKVTLLDPLLDDYKRVAPFLLDGRCGMSIPLEQAAFEGEYQLVFAINCIDHCEDIRLFLDKLLEACAANGRVILAVNTHRRRWTEKIWQVAQPIIEPHHPYHFTERSYLELISTRFQVEKVVDIEDEVIWINNETRHMPSLQNRHTHSVLPKILNKIRSGEFAGSFFVKLLAAFGLPQHDFKGTGNSIYRHKLFVLTPKRTERPSSPQAGTTT